ncbi:hypothetical protein [Chromobacterium sp.]|uniref:hypothetical protein n=1 Tax=Chromobacterium sp. TaxID=306190 RepID=UPI0035AF336D
MRKILVEKISRHDKRFPRRCSAGMRMAIQERVYDVSKYRNAGRALKPETEIPATRGAWPARGLFILGRISNGSIEQ